MTTDTKAAAPRPSRLSDLTPQQRKKLADGARRLATQCLTNGPDMTDDWCGCSIGTVVKGAFPRWREGEVSRLARNLEIRFSGLSAWGGPSPEGAGILSQATRERIRHQNPTAVVIPLLAWADELDEASGTAPQAPSVESEPAK